MAKIEEEDFYYMSPDQAILVTGVTWEIVRNKKIVEFSRCCVDMANVYPIEGMKDSALYSETKISLPIMQFGKMINGEPRRMYIAYSPDIEELLNKPYNIMHQDLENARIRIRNQDLMHQDLENARKDLENARIRIRNQDSRLRDFGTANFWRRLKYLFGI